MNSMFFPTFLLGIACGIIIGVYIVFFIKGKWERKYKKGIENMFSKVLSNFYEIKFIKRINKQAYFKFNDWELVLMLDKGTLHIFKDEECIASSTQVGSNVVISNVIKKIKSKWRKDIENTITIDNNVFSMNMIEEQRKKLQDPILSKIESESKKESFDLDTILDKINKVGYSNLSESELEFLKSLK